MSTSARVIGVLGLVLGLLTLVEWLFAPHHHPVFPWHHWPGFFVVIGLGGSLLLIKLAKTVGGAFLQRPEELDA